MAATDKLMRDQRTLDIVFAVSNILMLLSVVWMMWQDYAREYKDYQRDFREVEVYMAQRAALELVPLQAEFESAEKKVEKAKKFREGQEALDSDANFSANATKLAEARAKKLSLQPLKELADAAYQAVKADIDSINSFLNIALEHQDAEAADKYRKQLGALNDKLAERSKERDKIGNDIKIQALEIDRIEGPYTKAAAEFKNINDRFDTQVKLAKTKRWTIWDSIRNIPVIDGFAAPVKIHQFTINDIPIDYNFKYVTRFDRCMSCHLAIDRPAYTAEKLRSLVKSDEDAEHTKKRDEARAMYASRIKTLDPKDAAMVPNPDDISLAAISDRTLTAARLRAFAAHPRLDLFVGGNSKHPAEKFGCSSCHYGQGSGTSFLDASHSPNDSDTRAAWSKSKHWEPNHMWDFPMLPTRFVESSCLKCHHEVTDLVSTDNRVEAPKLLRGFNLIKENGCFGCHEISGWKGANRVGPDLRVEPSPPLDDLNPIERNRVINDPDNRPGNMRKVGPALTRVSEKVSEEWIKKWLSSPSTFRPDTKMPHYYNLSTNNEEFLKAQDALLKEDGALKQSTFPNTEMASIAYFLTGTSKDYLKKAAEQRETDRKELAKSAEQRKKDKRPTPADDDTRLIELLTMGRLTAAEQKEIDAVKWRIRLRKEAPLVNLAPKHKADKDAIARGKTLFIEKGCLSCHAHQGTEPTITGDAMFGPNLAQVPEKFGKSAEARAWLIQWIVNPQFHSPRSRMPQTHLDPDQAADVAAWLLEQKAEGLGAGWGDIQVADPGPEELKALARVYLTRMLSKSDMERFLKGELKGAEWEVAKGDLTKDEQVLYENVTDAGALKNYLGKKAVSRLGCYGCHDIPGFETVKSIGVGLNDWGKKPADRLAFEDIGNFFKDHYYAVPSLTDKDGKPAHGIKDKKEPYEEFYREALLGHNPERMGYLNQKVRDPRSYDFNRIRTWDDRARMPKFTFARPRPMKGEDPNDFEKRIFADEAAAREAVATFILGLTAEMVPAKMTNSQMTTDRLAEVKGRQVLDKYNCGGCHVVRPGVYDFKVSKATLANLDKAFNKARNNMAKDGEINLLNHVNWVGRDAPSSERLTTYSAIPTLKKLEDDDGNVQLLFTFNPAEALRFKTGAGAIVNLPASERFDVLPEDLPGGGAGIQSREEFASRFSASAPYGGVFADLMIKYLNKKDPKKYPVDQFGDSGDARAALPPVLTSQGERTQPDWLYGFLLNPQPVRKLSILRMPKFNLSAEEAKILVDYFAAVTRQTNPGIGLAYPREAIASREDKYWETKTAEYVQRLRGMPARDMDGKPIKGQTAYQQRVAEYTPIWEKMTTTEKKALEAELEKLEAFKSKRSQDKEEKLKAIKADKTKEAELKKEIEAIEQSLRDVDQEKKALDKAISEVSVASLQKVWEEKDAYAADGFRLVTSRKLCTQCHQVGAFTPSEKEKQGPPLALAHQRLRPGFVEHWVNKPQRFVPYSSMMPPYFNKDEWKYQPIHAGIAADQLQAVRDVLMNYPRIADMPINRLHNPDMATDKK